MVTVKATGQDILNFFKSHPAINVKKFCIEYDIPYDGFAAFLRQKDPRYKRLSLNRMNEVIPGLIHYGFKFPGSEIELEPTEEEKFLSENQ